MRSFRIRSRDTRLAVMFATAPESNARRAFAMSTNGVSTGTPTARTDRATCPPTSVSTRSMSWIIRSSTTATSDPRGLNGASRSLSMNRGASTYGSAARTARLNRSTWPVCTMRAVRSRDREQLVRLRERRRRSASRSAAWMPALERRRAPRRSAPASARRSSPRRTRRAARRATSNAPSRRARARPAAARSGRAS